ncbi:MAG: aromatic acid decarboxylase, partial [Proteobacteria bacterium]|nr:aromatic acid decarboxylase [Pseudomonadota bacterium]
KEKRPLILLPRETPLNLIHLKNMYIAAKAGATIMPPSPSFYSHPESISDLVDSVIARVLEHLKIEHDLVKEWGDNIV